MTQKVILRLFLTCMFSCAGLFLAMIWLGLQGTILVGKLIPTFFVIGLASFLVWFVSVLLDIRKGILEKR